MLCLAAIAAFIGCDKPPYELVPVSGTVTLEGEPLAGATVLFYPKASGDSTIVGPGSEGTTNEDGVYSLTTFKKESGAVVGRHRVTISTFKQEFIDFKNSDEVRLISEERVPKHYNERSVLTYEVIPNGTDEADFVLTAEKP